MTVSGEKWHPFPSGTWRCDWGGNPCNDPLCPVHYPDSAQRWANSRYDMGAEVDSK